MASKGARCVFLAGFVSLLGCCVLQAQVARVFVSVNGNDGNTCSNVATPCRTFGGGITQVDDGGEVIVLDNGSFGGTTITKGVTVNVPAGVTAFAAQPFTVSAPGKDVVLRGLTMKSITPQTGTAITFTDGASLTVENCVFKDWNMGVDMTATSASLIVAGSVFRDIFNQGVRVAPFSVQSSATVVGSRFEKCGSGVIAQDRARVWVRDSVFTGCSIGALASASTNGVPAELNVRNCLVTNNTEGLTSVIFNGGAAVVRVSGSVVMGNSVGLNNAGGTFESYGDNDVRANGTNAGGTITSISGTRM